MDITTKPKLLASQFDELANTAKSMLESLQQENENPVFTQEGIAYITRDNVMDLGLDLTTAGRIQSGPEFDEFKDKWPDAAEAIRWMASAPFHGGATHLERDAVTRKIVCVLDALAPF